MTRSAWTMVITWVAIVCAFLSVAAAAHGQALTTALLFFLFVSALLVAIERHDGR